MQAAPGFGPAQAGSREPGSAPAKAGALLATNSGDVPMLTIAAIAFWTMLTAALIGVTIFTLMKCLEQSDPERRNG